MIIYALAAIGLCASLRMLVRFVRWRFMVNRDGDSGRYGKHWSEE